MIHISLYYDGRRLDANGCGRVRLMINNHSRTALLDTGVKVAPDQWHAIRGRASPPSWTSPWRSSAPPSVTATAPPSPSSISPSTCARSTGRTGRSSTTRSGTNDKAPASLPGHKQRCGNAERQCAQMRLFVHLRGVYLIRVRQQALGDVAECVRQLMIFLLAESAGSVTHAAAQAP